MPGSVTGMQWHAFGHCNTINAPTVTPSMHTLYHYLYTLYYIIYVHTAIPSHCKTIYAHTDLKH